MGGIGYYDKQDSNKHHEKSWVAIRDNEGIYAKGNNFIIIYVSTENKEMHWQETTK